jgi:putative addiction module CopG family antidote
MVKLELDQQLESEIHRFIATGDYADASAVVREGLRLLELREKRTRLDHLLNEARAQYDRGEYQVWTPALMDEIERQVVENERQGIEIDLDPDVV